MRPTTFVIVLRWLIRLLALAQVVLGALFWTGNAFSLVQLHMLTGSLLVLALWAQAALAVRSAPWLSAGAVVWGLLVVVFGMTQDTIMPGDLHWLIKVLHLAVGLAAVGLAEVLARRALRGLALTRPAIARA